MSISFRGPSKRPKQRQHVKRNGQSGLRDGYTLLKPRKSQSRWFNRRTRFSFDRDTPE